MNTFKKTLIASALVAASVATQAETSINAGVTTDYVWRGQTQSAGPSVSGGIDYSSDVSGFYAGTWVGSLSEANGAEVDFYAGYATDAFDVGYIYYLYTEDNAEQDFGEIYGSYSVSGFTFGLAYTVNNGDDNDGGGFESGDLYYYGSYGGDLNSDWTYGLTLGAYTFDSDSAANELDYVHYGVDFGTSTDAGDFTFGISATDLDSGDDSNLRAVVSYSVAF